MMIRFFIYFLCLVSVTNLYAVKDSFVEFKAHNVGQGNCMTLKLSEKGRVSYMLVDAGSSGYKDMFCQEYTEKNKKRKFNHAAKTPPQILASTTCPSTSKASSPGSMEYRDGKSIKNTHDKKDDKILQIQQSLGKTRKNPHLTVKTIIISHPDEDHYNWVNDIFLHKDDKIENIILGGLPEKYSEEFQKWLKQKLIKSNLFCPAINCEQPLKNLESTMPSDKKRQYAPYMYSHPDHGLVFDSPCDKIKNLKNALPWGDDIKFYLLSVNSCHFSGYRSILRSPLDDTNSDSIVTCVKIGTESIVITGDATQLTSQRIIDNYQRFPDFFEGHVTLTADHHGSDTHGSNSQEWVDFISPSYAIVSCGTKHSHPAQESYNRLKDNLVNLVPRHNIRVYHNSKNPYLHETNKAIFSTFRSGDITVKLTPDKTFLITDVLKSSTKEKYYKVVEPVLLIPEKQTLITLDIKNDNITEMTEEPSPSVGYVYPTSKKQRRNVKSIPFLLIDKNKTSNVRESDDDAYLSTE